MEFLMMVESLDTSAGVPTGGSTATNHKIQRIHSICQTHKTSPKTFTCTCNYCVYFEPCSEGEREDRHMVPVMKN